jgi:hypothetical protein
MKRHIGLLLAGLIVVGSLSAAAQQPQPAPPPAPARPTVPARGSVPTPPPGPVVNTLYVDPSLGGQTVNIRLDVAISDQVGPQPSQPKMLTLLLADRSLSQLRTTFQDRNIRLDARPTIVDGKIKLTLTMDSQRTGDASSATLNWNQSLTVIVENGKPLVAVENSDPANNRKLAVEVKATILK